MRESPSSRLSMLSGLIVVCSVTGLGGMLDTARAVVLEADAVATVGAPAALSIPLTPASDMQSVLDAQAALGAKPIESLSVAEARRQPTIADAVNAVLSKAGKSTSPEVNVPGVSSVDRDIPGPGGRLTVRIFTPQGNGPFPVVVYFHGGGWVLANKQVYDGGARGLSKAAAAVVVSVDYRLAPEAKFPAAWDDALAAYKWVVSNAGSIKGDPKILALAGESAGGNLAVATAVAARDAGLTPPRAILAVYPVAQTGDMASPSYVDSGNAKPLNKAMISWFLDKLLAKPGDKADTRLDIVHANLKGLPPVTIINAQIDPLRDDGATLEKSLEAAGVKVERKVYDGATHEFFGTAAVVTKAKDAQMYAGGQLREAFTSP
jgi:acetyl esterase